MNPCFTQFMGKTGSLINSRSWRPPGAQPCSPALERCAPTQQQICEYSSENPPKIPGLCGRCSWFLAISTTTEFPMQPYDDDDTDKFFHAQYEPVKNCVSLFDTATLQKLSVKGTRPTGSFSYIVTNCELSQRILVLATYDAPFFFLLVESGPAGH
jgi:hypothetical protein